jgi:hypothetical protein
LYCIAHVHDLLHIHPACDDAKNGSANDRKPAAAAATATSTKQQQQQQQHYKGANHSMTSA